MRKPSKAEASRTRLSICPTPTILRMLAKKWPTKVPRHRLMRTALKVGLVALQGYDVDEFRAAIIADLADLVMEE
jgi:hypothetical protein